MLWSTNLGVNANFILKFKKNWNFWGCPRLLDWNVGVFIGPINVFYTAFVVLVMTYVHLLPLQYQVFVSWISLPSYIGNDIEGGGNEFDFQVAEDSQLDSNQVVSET